MREKDVEREEKEGQGREKLKKEQESYLLEDQLTHRERSKLTERFEQTFVHLNSVDPKNYKGHFRQ